MSSSLASPTALPAPARGPLGRLWAWLDAMPHPRWVCEISPQGVAAARSGRGHLAPEDVVLESLPEGALIPSPLELNLAEPEAVAAAVRAALERVDAIGHEVALLVPDQVVRVFRLNFERLPRRAEDVAPLLRWRLKKSVPFDVEETAISYMEQPSGAPGVEVLAVLAQRRIVRQYEELLEAADAHPGVMLGSTLAVLPLVESTGAALLARLSGRTLTTVIVRGSAVCVYRSTEMSADAASMLPQALVDEIYPAVAYFQDTWREGIAQAYLAGLGRRSEEFRGPLEAELGCPATSALASPVAAPVLAGAVPYLADRGAEALVGWMWNRGA